MSKGIKWYCIDLGDAIMATARFYRIQDQLTAIYQQSENKAQMQALYRYESGDIHCKLKVYISAAFQQMVCIPDAIICEAPTHRDLSLLVGKH